MSDHSMETVRRIFDDREGVFLEIGPDADALGLVELKTTNATSEEYYGKQRLCMRPDQARLIGNALILAALDADNAASGN